MITGADLTTYIQDHKFLDDAFKRLPDSWRKPVANKYRNKFRDNGRKAANLAVLDYLEAVDGFRFEVASDEESLRAFAKARVANCIDKFILYQDADTALNKCLEIAQRYGIEPPSGANVTKTGQRMRLLNEHWWRRQIRKTTARNVEGFAIKVGLVHKRAGLYASDETVQRRIKQKKRNRFNLENITAVNSNGQEYNLAELSDLGTSNPELRRMELMTRIAGFDKIAVELEHVGDFYTMTAPSKYHARHAKTGQENKKYKGFTPAESQRYLCKTWAKIRSKLHREHIGYYGFRVAEPHHDGTPHWHMIIFCEKANQEVIREVFRKYATQEDADELETANALDARFLVKEIDREKYPNGAAGYLAKYIAKNIDGRTHEGNSIGEDYEAIEGTEAVQTVDRVDAWASTWGIRQFQQLGGQSVTLYRELRRADIATIQGAELKAVASAADTAQWDQFTQLAGGAMPVIKSWEKRYSKKTGRRLKDKTVFGRHRVVRTAKEGAIDLETGEIRLNVYGEYAADRIKGFEGYNEMITTRLLTWEFVQKTKPAAFVIQHKPNGKAIVKQRKPNGKPLVLKRNNEVMTPWSSVNNCTQIFNEGKIDERNAKDGKRGDVAEFGDFEGQITRSNIGQYVSETGKSGSGYRGSGGIIGQSDEKPGFSH